MPFIPGTQKMATFDNVPIGPNLGGLFKVYPQMAEVDPVAVPMKAGDCSFHNGLTAHGAGANMTRGRRIAMTCAYMPEGSTFNGQQNILPDTYFRSLRVGDILDNDEQNPVVHARRQRDETAPFRAEAVLQESFFPLKKIRVPDSSARADIEEPAVNGDVAIRFSSLSGWNPSQPMF
jgi:ectoine hydroxylase-related dioxygenase (phytanoyl-CoA dioxygenase family)